MPPREPPQDDGRAPSARRPPQVAPPVGQRAVPPAAPPVASPAGQSLTPALGQRAVPPVAPPAAHTPPIGQTTVAPLAAEVAAERPREPSWLDRLAFIDVVRRARRTSTTAKPRRRWLRWLLVLVVVLAALFTALPYIAIGIAGRWLPCVLGGLSVEELRAHAAGDPVNIAVFVRPDRARALISAAAPRLWLPPWLLRRGQSASGTAQVDAEGDVVPLAWRLVISGSEPRPTVALRLTTAQAARLLAPYADMSAGSMAASWRIERARIEHVSRVEGPAPEWELAMDASGSVRLAIAGEGGDLPITRLRARLRLRFTPMPNGLSLSASIAIDEIATDAPEAAMLATTATRRQLEGLINAELKHRLAETVLPGFFPTDAVVTGEIGREVLKP
jgi:hypothetical protein